MLGILLTAVIACPRPETVGPAEGVGGLQAHGRQVASADGQVGMDLKNVSKAWYIFPRRACRCVRGALPRDLRERGACREK